ncbi:hypothetical protein PUN28_018485 [Cardiocondyla obscurior]|uniref:Uncharacterized protein n=1 Tax=Cardiocondyla obscurior TaxID=286306 RepID=A0AAW2EE17_9HYME
MEAETFFAIKRYRERIASAEQPLSAVVTFRWSANYRRCEISLGYSFRSRLREDIDITLTKRIAIYESRINEISRLQFGD